MLESDTETKVELPAVTPPQMPADALDRALRPARGFLLGLAVASVFWGALVVAWWWLR